MNFKWFTSLPVPEKKDGRGRVKGRETNLRAAEAPARPFFRPAADVRMERSGLASDLARGPRRAPLGAFTGQACLYGKRTEASARFPAPREQSRASWLRL